MKSNRPDTESHFLSVTYSPLPILTEYVNAMVILNSVCYHDLVEKC